MTSLEKLQAELEEIEKRKAKAIDDYDYQLAATLRDKEKLILQRIDDEHPAD